MKITYDGDHPDKKSMVIIEKICNDPHFEIEIERYDCEHFRQTVGEKGKFWDECRRCGRKLPGGSWDE